MSPLILHICMACFTDFPPTFTVLWVILGPTIGWDGSL